MNVRIILTTTEVYTAIYQYLRDNHDLDVSSNIDFINSKTGDVVKEPTVRIAFETDHFATGPYR